MSQLTGPFLNLLRLGASPEGLWGIESILGFQVAPKRVLSILFADEAPIQLWVQPVHRGRFRLEEDPPVQLPWLLEDGGFDLPRKYEVVDLAPEPRGWRFVQRRDFAPGLHLDLSVPPEFASSPFARDLERSLTELDAEMATTSDGLLVCYLPNRESKPALALLDQSMEAWLRARDTVSRIG